MVGLGQVGWCLVWYGIVRLGAAGQGRVRFCNYSFYNLVCGLARRGDVGRCDAG